LADALLKYHQDGGVGFLSFPDTPIETDQFPALQYAFSDYFSQMTVTSEIRVCVIDGLTTETFICLVNSRESFRHWKRYAADGPSFVRSAAAWHLPLIITLNGDIVGPGLELAMVCDVRLATPESQFRLPHVKMGWIPFEGGTQLLPRLIGKGKALEMVLTGSMIDARSAFEAGLIHYVVEKEDMKRTVGDMARTMAEKSSISLMYEKEAVNKGMDMTLEQGLRLEADLYFLMQTTDDRAEGIKAFKEKRQPVFKGR
jgi:enoyl-CoA hydratase/carnithine racemase